MVELPNGLIAYGPDTNCTLALCPVEWSILQYRPSVPANAVFIALFAVALIIHAYEGFRWRQTLTSFAIPMILGLLDEIIGYIGRLIMYHNPFSFSGFLMQISKFFLLLFPFFSFFIVLLCKKQHNMYSICLTCPPLPFSLHHYGSRLLQRCHIRNSSSNVSFCRPGLPHDPLPPLYIVHCF